MATSTSSATTSAGGSNSGANHRSSSAPRTTLTTTTTTTTTINSANSKTSSNVNFAAASVAASASSSAAAALIPLHIRFPVNAVVELILSPGAEQVQGVVYTTDEISHSVVLQKSLVHTTLANEIRIIHAHSIVSSKIISHPTTTEKSSSGTTTTTTTNHNNSNTTTLDNLLTPLPNVSRKALEEREKKALRSAEESLRHINQNASPEGQATFDLLVKACNDVAWKGESILVLGQIQVDPPYGPDQCRLLPDAVVAHHAGSQESLERVRKIVASVSTTGGGSSSNALSP